MDNAVPSVTENATQTRRAEILGAAAAVFAEKGYPRATVKEIAARSGVAPGTIYLYFENKRDLLLAIADWLIGQAVNQTLAQMAHMGPEAYIAAILQNALHFTRQKRAFLQALATEIWTDRELQEQFFTRILDPLFATGAGYLQALVAEGESRPCRVEIVVPTIVGSLIILSMLHALAPGQVLAGCSDDELVEELTRLYLYGLRPGPQTGSRAISTDEGMGR
jgi:AcrR family transcriptional regulator